MIAGVSASGSSKYRQVKLVKQGGLDEAKASLQVSSVHVYRCSLQADVIA